MTRDPTSPDYDPPQLGALVLLGAVGALGGLVGGFAASLTPLDEGGFVLGLLLGPAIAGWSVWRQGTNALGVGIAIVAALVVYGVIGYLFGVSTIPDAASA
jgi:hypothetical protein